MKTPNYDKKFPRVRKESSRVWQEAPEEGRGVHQPKRCEYYNKNEDNSPNNLDNNNYLVSQELTYWSFTLAAHQGN